MKAEECGFCLFLTFFLFLCLQHLAQGLVCLASYKSLLNECMTVSVDPHFSLSKSQVHTIASKPLGAPWPH